MTTYTVLISVPDADAPTLASDFAEHIKRGLEQHLRYSVAHVDAIRGDLFRLSRAAPIKEARKEHKHAAGNDYDGSPGPHKGA